VNCHCAHGAHCTYNFTKPKPLPTPFAEATDAFLSGPISSNKADRSCNGQKKTRGCRSSRCFTLHQHYLARDIKRKISNKDLLLINGCNSSAHDGTDFRLQSLSKLPRPEQSLNGGQASLRYVLSFTQQYVRCSTCVTGRFEAQV
jgi:hypothetical protein